MIYEAEDGVRFGGVAFDNRIPGYSGRGYVTGFHNDKCAVEFNVGVPADGFYDLSIGYSAYYPKINPVFVNGSMQGDRFFPRTEGFSQLAFGRIRLHSGSNVIRIGSHWGELDIDNIQIAPAPNPVPFRLSSEPVTPDASPETRKLYSTLVRLFGDKILTGQQDEHGLRLDYIAKKTQGKSPIVLGLDLLNYSGAYNRPDGQIERARDWVLNRKGIVTLSWHWFSPFGATEEVWKSFSANKTTFDPRGISDESSPEYAAVIKDMDLIAGHLKVLRDDHVPVLWRPLHEAEGGWFWWGAFGPEVTKHLYRLMFDRFTRIHGLNNLIWVWTTTDNPNARTWYPGDDVVDIIGADIYAPRGSQGTFLSVFDNLRGLYGGRKAIALAETGTTLDPDELARDGAPWLWFLVWDDFISRPEFNPIDRTARVYENSHAVVIDPSIGVSSAAIPNFP